MSEYIPFVNSVVNFSPRVHEEVIDALSYRNKRLFVSFHQWNENVYGSSVDQTSFFCYLVEHTFSL
jgi:hypothetical protein